MPQPGGTATVETAFGTRTSEALSADVNHERFGNHYEFASNLATEPTQPECSCPLTPLSSIQLKAQVERARRSNPKVWFRPELKDLAASVGGTNRLGVRSRGTNLLGEQETKGQGQNQHQH